jgi:hypothetical protein
MLMLGDRTTISLHVTEKASCLGSGGRLAYFLCLRRNFGALQNGHAMKAVVACKKMKFELALSRQAFVH